MGPQGPICAARPSAGVSLSGFIIILEGEGKGREIVGAWGWEEGGKKKRRRDDFSLFFVIFLDFSENLPNQFHYFLSIFFQSIFFERILFHKIPA